MSRLRIALASTSRFRRRRTWSFLYADKNFLSVEKILNDDHVSIEQLQECLDRSGYLLESRLVRSLTDADYFVEPNQVVIDARSGKSREIDLIAESRRYNIERGKVHVKTHFVIEASNNKFPFVLITERPSTPNSDFESYVQFICTPEPAPFLDKLNLYDVKEANWEKLFSQYCVLSRKSGGNKELMASHPDDVYGSLLKLVEYVEGEISLWNNRDNSSPDAYWRLLFWQPMIVLSGQLFQVISKPNKEPEIQEINWGKLEFNWHANEIRRTTVIEVVTESYFLKRLEAIEMQDDNLEQKMSEIRRSMRI